MRTTALVLMLASLAVGKEAPKTFSLEYVAAWFLGVPPKDLSPKRRGAYEKERSEYYRERYAGKPASGRVAVVAKRVDRRSGQVTLVGEVRTKVVDTRRPVVSFDLVLKDKDDPLLKGLKIGGKNPDAVIVTGTLDGKGAARLEACTIRKAD